ncbi:hypothetical protein AAU01_39530 [Paenarthrobacter aurescens]|uniref:Uncharacterized protein n=1 Tax=Paenarthrobacter aurescens TaxID=43663 RepID=A0A4Y3NQD7_PAEAU|nr:hypothetical protein AAU01_39530 [Paenarthrobacter aurescens]
MTTNVATNSVTMTVTDSRDIFPDTGPFETGACDSGTTGGAASAEVTEPEAPDAGLPLASDVTSVDMRIPQGLDLVSGDLCR